MSTTKEALGLTNKKVEQVINDFLEHLEVAGIKFVDEETKEEISEGFVLDNYMEHLIKGEHDEYK